MSQRKAKFKNIRPGYVAKVKKPALQICEHCRHVNHPSAVECVRCTYTLRKPSKVSTKPAPPLEHAEAKAFMRWVLLNESAHPELKRLFAVPNGGHRNAIVAAKMKAEGVRKGVLDYVWPVRCHEFIGLVIELKRTSGSRTSTEQDDWLSHFASEGWMTCVAKGAGEAIECAQAYLKLLRVKNPQAVDA